MLLIVDKKCTTLKYTAGVLQLCREEEAPRNIAVAMLEQVIIYGNALVESSVYRALAEAGVPTTLVATRGRQTSAYLSAGLATQLPLRRAQHRCADSATTRVSLAAEIVRMKLKSYSASIHLLSMLNVSEDEISRFLEKCSEAQTKLVTTKSHSSVLGIEGSVAQMWFVLVSRAIPIDYKFNGRNRRPPRDPVNAMLSLGYTLLNADVLSAVHAAGLDPSLGFLHADYPGRSSLVLDMCEPLRCGVDAMVLQIISAQSLKPEHFYFRDNTGCRLSKKARPIFFQAWANQRNHWPRPVNTQNTDPWPTAGIAEIANGQLQQFREQIKLRDITTSTDNTSPEENSTGDNVAGITFEELEDDPA